MLKIFEITGINYILKYIPIENISQYYCFCCSLDQINAGLESRKNFFKKKNIKNLTVQKLLTGSVYIYIYTVYIYCILVLSIY